MTSHRKNQCKMTRRPYTLDRTVRTLFSFFGMLMALYVIYILRGVLLPFLVACLIAYVLEPMVKLNMKALHMQRRLVPVILTLAEVLGLTAGLAIAVLPFVVNECTDLAAMVRRYATSQIEIPYISEQIHVFIKENVDFDKIANLLSREQWIDLAKKTMAKSWSLVTGSLQLLVSVVSWLIVVLYVIFIMIDYERLMLSFRQLIPLHQRHRAYKVMDDVKNAMQLYFRGQAAIAFTVGVLFSIGFYIVGLPMAILFGLFIGLLNMVPYLQLISLPVTALLCLLATINGTAEFWTIFWECMAIYVVVQGIQDLVLTPKIMGKAMGLNPAIILLSLSIWGCLLGFLGLIVALPLTTLLLSYYDVYVVHRGELAGQQTDDFGV